MPVNCPVAHIREGVTITQLEYVPLNRKTHTSHHSATSAPPRTDASSGCFGGTPQEWSLIKIHGLHQTWGGGRERDERLPGRRETNPDIYPAQ